ncbi:GntR family transcriptional regulator [Alsobacter sp. SYSU M60028]|uniref:GntR family transcriptional regulator n=1 Tax=Alsobacter ponti TaxID=2962936 RepID=A0ABT1LGL6_9HYPH|nr:GntR family transcriptional regulator [Alsobacter ponti]MCP8940028.1 GntR family transcriptional regulator [Alsobacter ponti]
MSEPRSAPGTIGAAPSGAARRPLHARILDRMRDAIRSGEWPVGSLLPSEQEIGEQHGASRITVRHALQRLQQEGYVRKQHGRRTMVIAREPSRRAWQMESLEDIVASADAASLDILSYRLEESAEAAEALGLPPATPLHGLRSLLTREGQPYARSLIYFPPDVGDRLTRADFDDVIVFRVLRKRLGLDITDVRMTVRATRAGAEDMRLLGCARGEPMLATELVYRSEPGGRPLEVAFTRFPADSYALSYSLTAPHGPA